MQNLIKVQKFSGIDPPDIFYAGCLSPLQTVRIFTLANPDLTLSIRNGKVILASTDSNDGLQARKIHSKYFLVNKNEFLSLLLF